MSELYDMIAGTSTGSLLATSLVFPNDPNNATRNKYFADDAINIYIDKGSIVFTKYYISAWARFVGTLIFTAVGCLLGFYIGYRMYYNKEHEETMRAFKEYVKSRKRTAKHHLEHSNTETALSLSV